MMMQRLESNICEPFQSLFERRRFEKIFDHYDSQHFGNEVLIYASSEISLQFIRDRSEISVDVGPADGSIWYMAPRLFEYLRLGNDLYGPADALLLRRHATLIDEAYDVLADLFRPERLAASESELRRFWKTKAEELFPGGDAG